MQTDCVYYIGAEPDALIDETAPAPEEPGPIAEEPAAIIEEPVAAIEEPVATTEEPVAAEGMSSSSLSSP